MNSPQSPFGRAHPGSTDTSKAFLGRRAGDVYSNIHRYGCGEYGPDAQSAGRTCGRLYCRPSRPPKLCSRRHKYTMVRQVCQLDMFRARHLEISLPVSGLACYPPCHPERMSRSPERSEGEGSLRSSSQILREARDDKHYLQMSTYGAFVSSIPLNGKGIHERIFMINTGNAVWKSP